jgi:hypothetical protein
MYLMAVHGEFDVMPSHAIFADTGWEPDYVYKHLDWLDKQFGHIIPILRVTEGNIKEVAMQATETGEQPRHRFVSLPLYVRNKNGTIGMQRRQCTSEFKLKPIIKIERELLGLRPRQRGTVGMLVQWIGISLDEATRMKPSQEKWKRHYYPLVERRMTRYSCTQWLEAHGYPVPQKSACIGCPFHDNGTWRRMKDTRPDDWSDAVQFDKDMRVQYRLKAEAFVHRSGKPLDEVDLSTQQDRGQQEFEFDAECEGMCGV